MGNMFWSNDGRTVRKNGDQYYTDKGIIRKNGNNLFAPDFSRAAIDNGNIVHTQNDTIRIVGNILFTKNGERYILNGNTLFGPHGEIWRGVSSMNDAKAIVAMRM